MVPCDQKRMINDSSGDSHVSDGVSMKSLTAHTRSTECNSSKGEAVVVNESKGNIVSEWQADFQKRQEQELWFTASGWKRDCTNGTEMKMLNSIQMKTTQTSDLGNHLRKHSERNNLNVQLETLYCCVIVRWKNIKSV